MMTKWWCEIEVVLMNDDDNDSNNEIIVKMKMTMK